MKRFTYLSGEEVKSGDQIIYHGDPGEVLFVVVEKVGDAELDWYLEEFGGGFMIDARGFGNVFIDDFDEDLEFVSRRQR